MKKGTHGKICQFPAGSPSPGDYLTRAIRSLEAVKQSLEKKIGAQGANFRRVRSNMRPTWWILPSGYVKIAIENGHL